MSQHLPPNAVVVDLVLRWSSTIGKAGTATVNDGALTFAARNHLGSFVMMSCPVHFDGEPSVEPPRWVLWRLGPGVWKLSPSVKDERLHAYVTIVDVPEPAPFLSKEKA
jgi:hypothetical protein